MRRFLLCGAILILAASNAHATILQAVLKDLDSANTAVGSTHRIQVWVKDVGYNGTTNLGISQAEFEILSDHQNFAQYTGTATFKTVGTANPVSAMGYGTTLPVKQDGTSVTSTLSPQPVVSATPDTDLDAIGLFFSAAPGSVVIDPSNAGYGGTVGSPNGPTGNGMASDANGFSLLAQESWVFNQSEHLGLYIDTSQTSALYYGPSFDASTGTNTSQSNVAITAAQIDAGTGINVPIAAVPEPASLVLMGLAGVFGLVAVARRRS